MLRRSMPPPRLKLGSQLLVSPPHRQPDLKCSFVVAPVYALHRHPDYFKRVNGIADIWPLCHEPQWKIDRATPFRDGN
jgi:hypothetical protein